MRKYITLFSIFILVFFTAAFYAFAVYPYHKNRKFSSRLARRVEKQISSSNTSCAIVIKDLKRPGVEYTHAQDKKFAAASMIKIHILAAALRACEEGKLNLSMPVVIEKEDITGGSGRLKCMKTPIHITLARLLRLMITRSDNTASNKVISMLGFDYINDTSAKLGATNTLLRRKMMDFSQRKNGVDNYTTAGDVSLVLEKIYNCRLYSKHSSRFAMMLLKGQRVNDRIPKLLPNTIIVAHKTGLEKSVVHDAGIIFSPKGDYILCVLTGNIHDYKKGKNFIAHISRLVYNLYS